MSKQPLPPGTFTLRARYLLTMQGTPTEDGYLTIADGQIVGIGKNQQVEPAFDLGDVILMPGLVNAHTHLEFSDLANPLPAGNTFPEWILAVIASRRRQRAAMEGPGSSEASAQAAVAHGLAESIRAGVTTIGEISTVPGSHPWYQSAGIQTVLFQEILGLSGEDIPRHVRTAGEHVETSTADNEGVSLGISPHAPYSVHYDLFEQLCQLAAKAKTPCALHLGESPAEMELLRSGSGPFREMLELLGAWSDSAIPRGIGPMAYLQQISQAPCSLIIHGNFLSELEYEFMAEQVDHMSLVYCPRTYHHFHDRPYPLQAILDHGVRVALGTDSRASNPDLNLLAEMQHVAHVHPEIDPSLILEMGSWQGARALGLEQRCGSLVPGKQADLVTIACEPGRLADLASVITAPGATVEGVMRAGRWLVAPTNR